MKRKETYNTFTEGLILDLDPLSMPNNALTNCLNGTLRTYNGNENVLQNDMGNARVETAMLPSGYIPLGSTSLGGIIYIVSYNPIDGKYQIGSFPSPERNLSKDELGDPSNTKIDLNAFLQNPSSNNQSIEDWFENEDQIIKSFYQKINLVKTNIYPGDKYKVFSGDIQPNQTYISAIHKNNTRQDSSLYPKYLKFKIISTLDNGKSIDLTNNSVWTVPSDVQGVVYPYYIYQDTIGFEGSDLNVDEYRGVVNSNYDTYISRSSGKLGIVAELEVPTSFSVGYDILLKDPNNIDHNDIYSIIKNDPNYSGYNIDTIYQIYFYLNWANDITGDHKNRVNPKGIVCSINSKESYKYPLWLKYKGGRNLGLIGYEQPNSTHNNNYFGIIAPENFYKDNFDIRNYIEQSQNIFSSGDNFRKNDGTDFQYILKGPYIAKVSKDNDIQYIISKTIINEDKTETIVGESLGNNIDLKITPYMPFGRLQFLERNLKIDLEKVQSEKIYLYNYQYYIDDQDINMDFYIESYPDIGKSIKEVTISFYPLKDFIAKDNKWSLQSTYDSEYITKDENGNIDKLDENLTYLRATITGNINGYQHIVIDRNMQRIEQHPNSIILKTPSKDIEQHPEDFPNNTEVTLTQYNYFENNKIYIVQFNLDYSGTERIFYRLMYNCTIFNSAYSLGIDFKDLYLYESQKNYGLSPIIKLKNTNLSSCENIKIEDGKEIPNESNLNYYKFQEDVYNVDYKYLISHNISSNFEIDSGLGSDLTLFAELAPNQDIEITATNTVSDENVKLEIPKDSLSGTIENNTISINNKIIAKVPYIFNYDNIKVLETYEFQKLKDGSSEHGIMLIHYSKHENEGYLELVDTLPNETYSADDVKESYYCPDGSVNLSFDLSGTESYLSNVLRDGSYDYITMLFGINFMKDNNCGYGSKIIGGSQKYTYLNKPYRSLCAVTCLLDDKQAIIVHKSSPAFSDTNKTPDDITEDNRFFKYNDYINTVTNNYNTNQKVLNDTYKKYQNTGKSITLYYIGDTSQNIENPSVTTTYNLPLNISSIVVKINDINGIGISIDQNKVGLANNLKIKDLNKFNSVINIEQLIQNRSFLRDLLKEDLDSLGWNQTTGEIISGEDLHKVYYESENGVKVDPKFILNTEMQVVLSNEASSRKNQCKWFFAWEDVPSDVYSESVLMGLKEGSGGTTKQSYKAYPTYDMYQI